MTCLGVTTTFEKFEEPLNFLELSLITFEGIGLLTPYLERGNERAIRAFFVSSRISDYFLDKKRSLTANFIL